MAVVNEHPNKSIRMLYAGEVAAELSMPVSDMVRIAERGVRRPAIQVQAKRSTGPIQNAEFAALVLLVQEWDSIAPWLTEQLFDDDINRMAFLALAETDGDLNKAIAAAPPDAVDVLERAAVADLNLVADVEARNLIRAACRRELQHRNKVIDPEAMAEDRQAKIDIEALVGSTSQLIAAAESLPQQQLMNRGTHRWGRLNPILPQRCRLARHSVASTLANGASSSDSRRAHRAEGTWPGGIHVELTGENVTS